MLGPRSAGFGRGGTAPLTLPDESAVLLYLLGLKFPCHDELLERQDLFLQLVVFYACLRVCLFLWCEGVCECDEGLCYFLSLALGWWFCVDLPF